MWYQLRLIEQITLPEFHEVIRYPEEMFCNAATSGRPYCFINEALIQQGRFRPAGQDRALP